MAPLAPPGCAYVLYNFSTLTTVAHTQKRNKSNF